MPRIPDELIERLKSQVSLEKLATSRGVELKRHGADLIGLCPFHDDREPSLVISPKKNLWHCLGACSAGGTVIDWVMKTEGVSFRHAVELLSKGEWAPSSTKAKVSTVRKLAPPIERDADDARLLGQVTDFYHETLKQSPDAQSYPEETWARASGDDRAIQSGILRTGRWATGCRNPTASPTANCGGDFRSSAFIASRDTSISMVVS